VSSANKFDLTEIFASSPGGGLELPCTFCFMSDPIAQINSSEL